MGTSAAAHLPYTELTGTLSVAGTGVVFTQKSNDFRWVSVHVEGTFSATLAFEASNDGSNWRAVTLIKMGAGDPVSQATAGGLYHGPVATDQFRVRCSAYTSGTATVSALFSQAPVSNPAPAAPTGANFSAVPVDGISTPGAPYTYSFPVVYNGTTWEYQRTPKTLTDVAAVTVTTIATVWTPADSKRFRLMGGVLSPSAAMSVLFEDNAAGAFVFRTPKLEANKPYAFGLGNGYRSLAVNNVLKATGDAAGTLTGTLYGTEES